MAFKQAYENADPVMLEPIMELEVTIPDDAVGAVNGDLNARRGRLAGMEPAAGMTTIKAEVPLAELLTYAQDLRALTSGEGDFVMEFARYEEVPSNLAQDVVLAAADA
jgi:elongation factor G